MKQKLSPKSRAIVERFYLHRDRCRVIESQLGEPAAKAFHIRHKSNPGSMEAEEEFQRLIEIKLN